jgi:hypothetical protein
MSDLRSKLAASGTLVVPTRAGAADDLRTALPDEMCLEVLRFATTQDLGRLGRTGTAWRNLSLRELTRLPGDYQLRRMGWPDHRVYFQSVVHGRAQWEKPSRAVPPRALDPNLDMYPPQHFWPLRPAPPPRQTAGAPGDWWNNKRSIDEYQGTWRLPKRGEVYWFSYHLRTSQWERPCYEDAPLPGGHITRANPYFRTAASSNYLDQSA